MTETGATETGATETGATGTGVCFTFSTSLVITVVKGSHGEPSGLAEITVVMAVLPAGGATVATTGGLTGDLGTVAITVETYGGHGSPFSSVEHAVV